MKKENSLVFKANPEKASTRIGINSFMMGSLFFILTLIWVVSPEKFNVVIVVQLVLAIPLLFVSSLAYSKIAYRKETKLWDIFGWFTNNLGSIFVLNSVGLMAASFSRNISFLYFGLTLSLMLVYSLINIIYEPHTFKEKLFKFLFFLVVLLFGGVLPLF